MSVRNQIEDQIGGRIRALWARTGPLRERWARTEAGAHRHVEAAQDPGRTQRILVFSGLTGCAVGLVVVVIDKAAHDWLADPLGDQPLWLRAAGPAIGLVVAWAALGALTDKATPDTTDDYVRSFHRDPPVPIDPAPAVGRTVAGVGTDAARRPSSTRPRLRPRTSRPHRAPTTTTPTSSAAPNDEYAEVRGSSGSRSSTRAAVT